MIKLKNAFTLLAFLMVLTGCASMGNEKADTFSKQLAYATGINKAVVDAVTSSTSAGTLGSDDAASVLAKADEAHAILVAANSAYQAGDQAGAQSKLATALTALTALQDFLRSKGAMK